MAMSFTPGDTVVWVVFVGTYLGMASGGVPGLALDRIGITLSALIVLLLSGTLSPTHLAGALELPTLVLLFALMIITAHFELAHGFDWIADHLSRLHASPRVLLALVIGVGGLLSMVLVNDIVAFAFTPMLCRGLRRRGLDPRPYLLALAGAVNGGSSATLIGNPQNILIGQLGELSFLGYTAVALVPAIVTLVVIYVVIVWVWRGALSIDKQPTGNSGGNDFSAWLGLKSLFAALALVLLLATVQDRVVAALGVALILLLGRRFSTRDLLSQVDGSLLVMIGCLFAVTAAATELPQAERVVDWLEARHLLPYDLGSLALFSVVASNTIGNVPAVVLLLKAVPDIPTSVLYGLALFSTLSGNLLLTGSLANIIVAERGAQAKVTLGFIDFARVGIPVTLLSMTLAGAWLGLLGILG
ncbi:SLC13 family permease [Nitrosococcus watsonii]|uniref:Citrate transporter n=1 Tax=Nitrosococcus watsoni (strain C-113) TaxID=105559 RepID=D8K5R6_NITWC|nr:SLC13 family permease [Nitrosococcus watsonii]ADJ28243.1 Citrate transporter [Nitrosococcus watsonii C-113]